jgi:prepilin-type N-terminal cleavage/methylation domain-containing protein
MRKRMKNRRGFTLVEVIVVAVIVAILAAVAVPLYLQYVDKARLEVVNNACGSAASFFGACLNAGGTAAPATGAVAAGATVTCTAQDIDGNNVVTYWTCPKRLAATIAAKTVYIEHVDNTAKNATCSFQP